MKQAARQVHLVAMALATGLSADVRFHDGSVLRNLKILKVRGELVWLRLAERGLVSYPRWTLRSRSSSRPFVLLD